MTYEELVAKVKQSTEKSIVSKTIGHVAFQFNVEGEAEGAFYLEIDNGKINVEPYEYYDRDIIIVTSADVILQMLEATLQPRVAYGNGVLKVYGDIEHLSILPFGREYKKNSQKQ